MIGCVCLVVVATMEIARSGRVPADAAAGRLGLGSGDNESLLRQLISQYFTDRIMADSASCQGWIRIQAPLSRKRMSISRTVSDLTGNVQSAGVEKEPVVEHLMRKARKPLVPPTNSIWRPEITFLQIVQ